MLFSILSGDSFRDVIVSLLLTLPVILFALSVHETAHGFVAWKCGDPTARNLGRLTLNPIRHLDPIGFLCMLVFGYGWAKPVPINARYFKNPRVGMALTAAAGPLSNFLTGLINSILYGFTWALYSYLANLGATSFWLFFVSLFNTLFYLGCIFNFLYAAFNLIPVPPFDGSRIVNVFLPAKVYFGIMRYERQIMFVLLIGILVLSRFGLSPFSWVAYRLTSFFGDFFGNLFWIPFRNALAA